MDLAALVDPIRRLHRIPVHRMTTDRTDSEVIHAMTTGKPLPAKTRGDRAGTGSDKDSYVESILYEQAAIKQKRVPGNAYCTCFCLIPTYPDCSTCFFLKAKSVAHGNRESQRMENRKSRKQYRDFLFSDMAHVHEYMSFRKTHLPHRDTVETSSLERLKHE